jgi:hypothetical protein
MVVNVNVFTMMVVAVLVFDAGGMKMKVPMGFVPVGRAKTPYKIRNPEADEKPGSYITANGFEQFQFLDGYTKDNAQKAQNHGTPNVPDAA